MNRPYRRPGRRPLAGPALCFAILLALAASVVGGLATPARATAVPPGPGSSVGTLWIDDWRLVTQTSAVVSAAVKVTATCPTGMQVVGTGGRVIPVGTGLNDPFYGMRGRVSITDIVPSEDLTSVSVTVGIRDKTGWNPAVDTYQAQAQARCVRTTTSATGAPPVVSGALRVAAASPLSGTTDLFKEASAACPTGTTVYGTGYQIDDAQGRVFVYQSFPLPDLRSVRVWAYDDDLNHTSLTAPFNGSWGLTAYAICAQSRGTDAWTYGPTPIDSTSSKTATSVQCPTGTLMTGAGFTAYQGVQPMTAVGSYIAVVRQSLSANSALENPAAPATTLNVATAGASLELTDPASITAYAICH